MYATKIQLRNYGPIKDLTLPFPFTDNVPDPVVLVGENGSGKSILLSHIVNGLIVAKQTVFPDTPEVDPTKVYKLRSNNYIHTGAQYSFARVDYQNDFYVTELRLANNKDHYDTPPAGVEDDSVIGLWNNLTPTGQDRFDTNIEQSQINLLKDIFRNNCILYFPFNRFEEPAWLNARHLRYKAHHMDQAPYEGETNRQIISYSPLKTNQDWLFEILYDRAVFEMQLLHPSGRQNENLQSPSVSLFAGYHGRATATYEAALQIASAITRTTSARFGIGRRGDRRVSLESDSGSLVPNLFQLSSGETSLLDIFMSVLRDFDSSGAPYAGTADIRGIVIIDEADLHLHAHHQHDVLPDLIKLFPKIQFIITTHSPLFVLGMKRAFGDNGFAIHQMPDGRLISPEEFSEFGEAYSSFRSTQRFSQDIRSAIDETQKPILITEGVTEQHYLRRAAQFLGREEVLGSFAIRDGGGRGNLAKVWKHFNHTLTGLVGTKVLLLFDCDRQRQNSDSGSLFQRTIPFYSGNPIRKGIENLFGKASLEEARCHKPEFFDVEHQRRVTERGVERVIPEIWSVNDDEKMNLCDWLCQNGSKDDFECFEVIFNLMHEVLHSSASDISANGPAVTE